MIRGNAIFVVDPATVQHKMRANFVLNQWIVFRQKRFEDIFGEGRVLFEQLTLQRALNRALDLGGSRHVVCRKLFEHFSINHLLRQWSRRSWALVDSPISTTRGQCAGCSRAGNGGGRKGGSRFCFAKIDRLEIPITVCFMFEVVISHCHWWPGPTRVSPPSHGALLRPCLDHHGVWATPSLPFPSG